MLGLTLASFLPRLRVRLGSPSTAELSDVVLQEATEAALREYSKVRFNNFQALNITLQPYQELYTLGPPAPLNVLDVIPAAPTTASARAFGNEFRALELDLISFAIMDLFTMQERVSQYREMFEQVEWHYDNPPNLYLTPSPLNAMQALVLVSDLFTIEDVRDADYEVVLWGAQWKAFEMWADQRDSLSVMTAPASIGTLQLVDGSRLRERAREKKAEFQQRLGWNRTYLGQG